jgi:hypothetical protein
MKTSYSHPDCVCNLLTYFFLCLMQDSRLVWCTLLCMHKHIWMLHRYDGVLDQSCDLSAEKFTLGRLNFTTILSVIFLFIVSVPLCFWLAQGYVSFWSIYSKDFGQSDNCMQFLMNETLTILEPVTGLSSTCRWVYMEDFSVVGFQQNIILDTMVHWVFVFFFNSLCF